MTEPDLGYIVGDPTASTVPGVTVELLRRTRVSLSWES